MLSTITKLVSTAVADPQFGMKIDMVLGNFEVLQLARLEAMSDVALAVHIKQANTAVSQLDLTCKIFQFHQMTAVTVLLNRHSGSPTILKMALQLAGLSNTTAQRHSVVRYYLCFISFSFCYFFWLTLL